MAKRKVQPNDLEGALESHSPEGTLEGTLQEQSPEVALDGASEAHFPEVDPKQPAEVQLITPQAAEGLAPAKSKEEIEASIQEKLSRKTDKDGADPFVPNIQLENEVKEIANKNGFPLSRGTEIGARLMARAKRN